MKTDKYWKKYTYTRNLLFKFFEKCRRIGKFLLFTFSIFFSETYEKKKKKINDFISNITETDVNLFFFLIFWWFVISKGFQPPFVDVHIFAHWAERLQWENITRHKILIAARHWAWCWFWCSCWWWRCSTFREPLNWQKWDDWCTIYMVVSTAIAFVCVCDNVVCTLSVSSRTISCMLRLLLLCWLAYYNQLIGRFCKCISCCCAQRT